MYGLWRVGLVSQTLLSVMMPCESYRTTKTLLVIIVLIASLMDRTSIKFVVLRHP